MKLLTMMFLAGLARITSAESLPKDASQAADLTLVTTKNVGEKIVQPVVTTFQFQNRSATSIPATNLVIGVNTNKLNLTTGTTNAFRSVVFALKPDSSTNLNTKAILNRVAIEADKMVVTGQAFQIQQKPLEPSR